MISVEFQEPLGPITFERWPEAADAPAIGDQVDLLPMGSTNPLDDEVVATVTRREWYRRGKAVVCYVSTR